MQGVKMTWMIKVEASAQTKREAVIEARRIVERMLEEANREGWRNQNNYMAGGGWTCLCDIDPKENADRG
jgi:exopolyphosphatase/pppGpp-phosphohydrolase